MHAILKALPQSTQNEKREIDTKEAKETPKEPEKPSEKTDEKPAEQTANEKWII